MDYAKTMKQSRSHRKDKFFQPVYFHGAAVPKQKATPPPPAAYTQAQIESTRARQREVALQQGYTEEQIRKHFIQYGS